MNVRQFLFSFSAALTVFAGLGSALGDGYRNPPPTAVGIGKSGVNRVFVDDASAIYYNPANLTEPDGLSVVLDSIIVRTKNEYNGSFADPVESEGDWTILPNFYASAPLGDTGMALGLGITVPYGQGIEWGATDLYNPYAPISLYKAEIKMVDIAPTVAFRLGDRLSIGLGANIYYSELEFDGLTSTNGVFGPPGPPSPPTGTAHAEGDDVAVGGSLGVTLQLTDRQRAVFAYRSEVELEYEGDLSASGLPLASSDFGLAVTYPTVIGFGYGIELTEDIRVEANVEWLDWSKNEVQKAELGNGTLSIPQNWEDTFTFGIGGDWQLDENWVIRAGYAFIETPIPDATLSPILPDADRHALSLGMGYTSGAHSLDLAYTVSIYDDRSASNPAYPGDYDIDSDLIGLTYSYLH